MNSKSFKYEITSIGSPAAVNGIMENATTALPLKYLSKAWRWPEIRISKVELKLKWTKHCVLATDGVDNVNANHENIVFTINDTKFYVFVATLSAKGFKTS